MFICTIWCLKFIIRALVLSSVVTVVPMVPVLIVCARLSRAISDRGSLFELIPSGALNLISALIIALFLFLMCGVL